MEAAAWNAQLRQQGVKLFFTQFVRGKAHVMSAHACRLHGGLLS
jgi:hypothetical protein